MAKKSRRTQKGGIVSSSAKVKNRLELARTNSIGQAGESPNSQNVDLENRKVKGNFVETPLTSENPERETVLLQGEDYINFVFESSSEVQKALALSVCNGIRDEELDERAKKELSADQMFVAILEGIYSWTGRRLDREIVEIYKTKSAESEDLPRLLHKER